MLKALFANENIAGECESRCWCMYTKLGFHRHDVISKYVSKEKASRQICAPWRKLYFSVVETLRI